jgi:mono/diheme cytochrome c family protein
MMRSIAVFTLAGTMLLALSHEGKCADAAAGQAVYAKKCASCHGKQGEGNPTMEKMLKVSIKPLSAPEIQAKSDDQLRKEIAEGTGKMKPVKDVSAEDVNNVILHVRSLKK